MDLHRPLKRRKLGTEELEKAHDTARKLQELVQSFSPKKDHKEKEFYASQIIEEGTEKRMNQAKETSLHLNKQILVLENLQFEKNHYLRGIQACRNFADLSSIELLPQQQFFSEAQTDLTPDSDPHKIMLKRLEHELTQRSQLREKLEELRVRYTLITADNLKKQTFLESLSERVAGYARAALPVKEFLGLPSLSMQQNRCNYLSPPLYFLYTHLLTFQNNSGSTLKIVGDIVESIDEEPLAVHPLSLEWTILCVDAKKPITTTLHVRHVANLNAVTVQVKANIDSSVGVDHLLLDIVPEDSGTTWPENTVQNPSAGSTVPSHLGRAYKWLQQVCGLAPYNESSTNPQRELLNLVVSSIKYRVNAEKTLQTQFDNLSRGRITVDIKTKLPIRNFATISEFVEISYSEWESIRRPEAKPEGPTEFGPLPPASTISITNGETRNEPEEGEIGAQAPEIDTTQSDDLIIEPDQPPQDKTVNREAGCRYFKMGFKCDKDEYKALITISPGYPKIAPFFILSTKDKHKKQAPPVHLQPFVNAQCVEFLTNQADSQDPSLKTFNNNLQLIQEQINFGFESFMPHAPQTDTHLYLLSYQIRKLKMCLDMAYELGKKGADSALGKMLGRVTKGRDRHMGFNHYLW